MKLKKVIISGGPGTGKSSIINELKNRGYLCFDEVWKKEYKNPKKTSNSDEINTFSQYIFLERLKHLEIKPNKKTKENLVFYDRSIIDTISYLKAYKKNIKTSWKNLANKKRYHETIFFCPTWKEIYKQTDGRKESFQESILIEKYLTSTYKEFLYKINTIPKLDIKNRVDYILENI